MVVSEKYIMDAQTFLEDYYMLSYDRDETLSHKVLGEFLQNNNKKYSRLRLDGLNKERILRGTCILVKDEVGQIIPYRNPYRTSFSSIELNNDAESLKEIRLQLLKEQGLTYDEDGNVIPIKEPGFIKRLFMGGNKNDKH